MAEREEEPPAQRPLSVRHEFARGVVDAGDVVGVERVPEAEEPRGDGHAEPHAQARAATLAPVVEVVRHHDQQVDAPARRVQRQDEPEHRDDVPSLTAGKIRAHPPQPTLTAAHAVRPPPKARPPYKRAPVMVKADQMISFWRGRPGYGIGPGCGIGPGYGILIRCTCCPRTGLITGSSTPNGSARPSPPWTTRRSRPGPASSPCSPIRPGSRCSPASGRPARSASPT